MTEAFDEPRGTIPNIYGSETCVRCGYEAVPGKFPKACMDGTCFPTPTPGKVFTCDIRTPAGEIVCENIKAPNRNVVRNVLREKLPAGMTVVEIWDLDAED